METKICTKCKKELPLDMFCNDKTKKGGKKTYCKACEKEMCNKYYVRNKKRIKKYNKIYYEEHKRHIKEANRKYQIYNKEKVIKFSQIYRAKKANLPATLTEYQWESIKLYFNNKCCYCGKELPLQQEHFIPLSKGGEYTHNNIIPACKSCNCSKSNSSFFEWYHEQEFYNKKREKIILEFLNYNNSGEQQLSLAL